MPVLVYLKEKSGKERFALILRIYQDELKNVIIGKEVGKPIFKKYTTKIDNHAFRREYAKKRYKEILGYIIEDMTVRC